ncbi:MAG: glucosamine-6-phosphate deaminase [Acholeplasma sp.]|nr:glucosamine-6-phosphate deaminase [Acholeplasma sp.]
MEIKIYETKELASQAVAKIILDLVKSKPTAVLGLATGGTPVAAYRYICDNYQKMNVSFKNIKTFNLDEYYNIKVDHPQSYRYFMNDNLFNHIDIDKNNTFIPDDSYISDPSKYDLEIEKCGGIDLQLLGIGINGHIGFNEPSEKPNLETHVEVLTDSTRNANKRFFNNIDEVPTKAITMGINTILKSKKIVLLALGKEKHEIISRLISATESSSLFPASYLIHHNDLIIVTDKDAYEGGK